MSCLTFSKSIHNGLHGATEQKTKDSGVFSESCFSSAPLCLSGKKQKARWNFALQRASNLGVCC